jgi:putative CocE/NonD family hydrolase
MVYCRDGVGLHTRVTLPRNDSGRKFTTIVDRSPYGYDDLEWLVDLYVPFDFVAVGQDFRGTHKSEGRFSIWHLDANDSEDLGNWIVQQPWSNGQVYTFGASADGLGAFTTVQNEPSWLGAQYFIWASSIGYDVFFPGGTMLYDLIVSWIHHTVEGDWADVCYEDIIKNEMKTGNELTQMNCDRSSNFSPHNFTLRLVGAR